MASRKNVEKIGRHIGKEVLLDRTAKEFESFFSNSMPDEEYMAQNLERWRGKEKENAFKKHRVLTRSPKLSNIHHFRHVNSQKAFRGGLKSKRLTKRKRKRKT